MCILMELDGSLTPPYHFQTKTVRQTWVLYVTIAVKHLFIIQTAAPIIYPYYPPRVIITKASFGVLSQQEMTDKYITDSNRHKTRNTKCLFLFAMQLQYSSTLQVKALTHAIFLSSNTVISFIMIKEMKEIWWLSN